MPKVKFHQLTSFYCSGDETPTVFQPGEVYEVAQEDLDAIGGGFEVMKTTKEKPVKEEGGEQKAPVAPKENKMVDSPKVQK